MRLRMTGSSSTRVYTATVVCLIFMAAVLVGVFYFLYAFPPPDITETDILGAPVESIPFDGGWIGLALIVVNGFLLSFVLMRDSVGFAERLLLSIALGFGMTFVLMIFFG